MAAQDFDPFAMTGTHQTITKRSRLSTQLHIASSSKPPALSGATTLEQKGNRVDVVITDPNAIHQVMRNDPGV